MVKSWNVQGECLEWVICDGDISTVDTFNSTLALSVEQVNQDTLFSLLVIVFPPNFAHFFIGLSVFVFWLFNEWLFFHSV